jgi:iron(III) transport system substrate-binding protein
MRLAPAARGLPADPRAPLIDEPATAPRIDRARGLSYVSKCEWFAFSPYEASVLNWIRRPVDIIKLLACIGLLGISAGAEAAEEPVLNIYSARHYQSDDALYADFTKATGIAVNRIEDREDPLIERISNEGENSPADILITADAGRLWRADSLGLFQPANSAILDQRIPASLRQPGGDWFGFSKRARVIYYNKAKLGPDAVARYEDLADPKWRGQICMRSGSAVYNLSLLASIIAADGATAAEAWAKGVVANFARPPQGGDIDQIKAVAAGECALAVGNTYYYVRLMKSADADDREAAAKVGVIWPNQGDRGAHVNVSGAGILKYAPHPGNALKFLEFLASDEAQRDFALGNNEYPVVDIEFDNPELRSLGTFKPDPLNVGVYGQHQAEAQEIYDDVGWR